MKPIRKHSALLAAAVAGTFLLAIPLQSAFSATTGRTSPGSMAVQGAVTSLTQGTATIALEPNASVELRICLLLTKPMVEIPSQKSCRVVTTLAYCAVGDTIQDSIDVQAHTVGLSDSEPLNAWVDYTVDGTEQSYEVSLQPKAGFPWGKVKGLQDVSIQTTRL